MLCLFFCHLVHLYHIHLHHVILQDNHPIYRLWAHNVMTNVGVDAGIDAKEANSRSEASRFSDSLSPALLRCLTSMPHLLPSFFPPGPSTRTKIDGYLDLAQQFIPRPAYSRFLPNHGHHIPIRAYHNTPRYQPYANQGSEEDFWKVLQVGQPVVDYLLSPSSSAPLSSWLDNQFLRVLRASTG